MSYLRNRYSEERLSTAPRCSFYPLLVNFHLQIAYRKVRNLQIGVDNLVGKVSINLLCHAKLTVCIISIIISLCP